MNEKGKITGFEDLDVWKKSMAVCVEIYKLFAKCRDYGFKDQICRSAVSVPSNISEGFDRQTNKEFIQFLYIAKGSCAEMRTQIYLAIAIEYVKKEQGIDLLNKAKEIGAMLNGLIKTRKKWNKNKKEEPGGR